MRLNMSQTAETDAKKNLIVLFLYKFSISIVARHINCITAWTLVKKVYGFVSNYQQCRFKNIAVKAVSCLIDDFVSFACILRHSVCKFTILNNKIK